jgi:hypothetical protein
MSHTVKIKTQIQDAELIERTAQLLNAKFLGMGKHAREDLPQLMADLTQQHPQVRFAVRPAVGEDPEMIALLARLALS